MACVICGATATTFQHSVKSRIYARCAGCGVTYQSPLPPPSRVAAIYNQDDAGYFVSDAKNADFLAGEAWLRQSARFFIERLRRRHDGDLRAASVLDFGCGTGILLDELQRAGVGSCLGVEMSPWACRYGRERFGLTMLNEDIMSAPLAEGSFDAIIMSHVIEHLPDPPTILRRLASLLRVGGTLMICTPNADSPGARIFGKKWLYYLPDEHLHLFNDRSIEIALQGAGLRPLAVERYLWRKRTLAGALLRLPLALARTALQGAPQFVTAKDGLIAFGRKEG